MVKTLFQNSKAALIFAGVTIFGATAMVGSQEDSGVLLKAVSVAEARGNLIAGQAQSSAPPPPSVFGEFAPQAQSSAAPGTAPSPAATPATAPAGAAADPMSAPLSATAMVNPAGAGTPE